jgi:signal transduction histidine kinase
MHFAFARGGVQHSTDDLAIAAEFAERVSLALENARLHQTASRALAARDELLAFVTHDLRNFLTTIIFGAEVLAQSGSKGERRSGRRQVDAIRQAGIRMASVLDALRDAGMIEAGQFRIESRSDDLRGLLAESVGMMQVRADMRQVRLELRISSDLPELSFDHERIHQVLANLVGNAIEHSLPGGLVLLEAAFVRDEDYVRITVRDEGPGISPESLPHLFERYWRKDTHDRKGTGLGLFIAKGIVEAHEGSLSVETEIGRGTTFMFSRPTERVQVSPASGMDPTAPSSGAGGVAERPVPKRSGAHAKVPSASDHGKRKLSG